MVRLPLLINKQRIKTLEELRENFNLTELIERYQGGQLRAWLNCWDFISELEQVEALSSDLLEQELLEALCRIFGVEGEAKEQALTAFREEQEKREEQQQEAKRQQKLREQEEQRKAEQTKPLTLDEIEFDWQEAEGPKIDLLTSGADRFVAIADKRGYYSYNGIQWKRANLKWEENYVCRLSCCNGNFILDYNRTHYVYSNFTRWNKIEFGDNKIHIDKIIWTGDHYIALGAEEYQSSYETGTFFKKTETHWVCNPIIYTSDELTGPWHRETVDLNGAKYISDGVWFNNRLFAFYGTSYETIIYSGSTLTDLTRHKEERSGCGVRVWVGMGKCFRGCFTMEGVPQDSTLVTDDGIHWKALKYGIEQFVDADRFIVARLFEPGRYSFDTKDIGFHLSLDGINWRKLNAPLQNGKIAYLDGKLLIADGSKLAVGTLKVAHKSNTPSCSTHSCNTSTEDRDLHYNVELSAEEAKSGTIKEVTVTRTEICSLCSGSGRESGSGEKNCTNCNGCGLVQGSKSIKVRIPADVKSGAKLRIRGQGNAGRGEAQPGDLYVHITVREEPSVSPSQTNSTDHTTPLKEIADAMNPLKNPAVLISPTGSIAKLIATKLKSSDNISELIATHLKSGIISEEGKNK